MALAEQRLVSLLDMLRFFASEWNQIMRDLDQLASIIGAIGVGTQGPKERLTDPLVRIAANCDSMGLKLSAKYARKILDYLASVHPFDSVLRDLSLAPINIGKFSDEMKILKDRFEDELEGRELFVLEGRWAEYFSKPHLFGEEVYTNFNSATFDIEEAGKCLAFDRWTACVFHLMRVMEVGLRALGRSLNNPALDPKTNPTWERILKPCDDELRKPFKERCLEWQADEVFFSNATANLRAVKDAWRNPSLHVEINYDGERAGEIFTFARTFMRHIATRLHE